VSISLDRQITGEVLVRRKAEPHFYPVAKRTLTISGIEINIHHFLDLNESGQIHAYWVFDKIVMWMMCEEDSEPDEPRDGHAIIENESDYHAEIDKLDCIDGNIRVFHDAPHILAARYDGMQTTYVHTDADRKIYAGLNIYDYEKVGSYCLGADGNVLDFESAMSLYMNKENFDLHGQGPERIVHYDEKNNRLEIEQWPTCRQNWNPVAIPHEITDFARSLS